MINIIVTSNKNMFRVYRCFIFFNFLVLSFLCCNCSRKNNPSVAKIYRIYPNFTSVEVGSSAVIFSPSPTYEWEVRYPSLPSFTKYSFKCPGTDNPDIPSYKKCLGYLHHGLPLCDGKETIYPRLIELLNFLQKASNRKIIILRGHICPKVFALLSEKEQNPKYLIGAAVKIGSHKNLKTEFPDLIKKFYAKNKECDNIQQLDDYRDSLIFNNTEFKFTIHEAEESIIEIEVLYNKIKEFPVIIENENTRNYLLY